MYKLETTKHNYMYTGTAMICIANIENHDHTVTIAMLKRKFNNKP